ncbi:hypothetical protein D3C87_1064520 [compost metagenome]
MTGATEQLGAAAQRVLVGNGQTFRADVAIPDDVAHAHPLLRHLAANQVQVLDRVRVVVDVTLVQPDLLLVEVVVQALVGGSSVVVVAGGDTDTGVDLRVDLGVGTQAGTNALTVLVFVVGYAIVVDVFLTEAHVALELGLGSPGQFLVESAQCVGFLRGGRDLLVGLLLSLTGDLLVFLIPGQLGLQFAVLRVGDRAVSLEHVEQFGVDCGTGRNTHGQQQATAQGRRSFRGSKTHINLRR